jgi:pimeloyl-ACP methyl ester carboxylesterase
MPNARNGDVDLAYEVFGDPTAEAVLLINGLGSQMTRWPADFCNLLVARGYQAIRMDNRDTGLSSWPEAGYTLADMARDSMAVLDAAGVKQAHIAGVSMGGMIVQRIAINHPERVRSMTSIMSAPSGNVVATPEAMAVISQPPPDPAADYERFVAHGIQNARTIGSPGYPWTEAELRARVIAEHARAFNPAGVVRQRRAIGADGDRTAELQALNVPTVVLHGADDPLVQPVGGEATATAIPGAELRMIPGMGHDMPPGLCDIFLDAILSAAGRAAR